MATSGNRAFATTLIYTTGSKTIGELTSIGGIELTADTIEMTSHQSASRYREFIQGVIDGGEVAIAGVGVPGDSGQAQVLTHFAAGDSEELTITFPDSSNWVFDGIVTSYKAVNSAELEGKLEFTGTFKVTGVPAFSTS